MDLKRLFSWGRPEPSGQGPAPRASTSPPRSRSPQLDGMPGSLGVRCSPDPPAQRTTTFSDLQRDALSIIAHKLSEGPPAEAGRHLANASMTNRALRSAVAGDEQARRCLPLARKARQLAGSLLSGNPDASQAGLCLPVLGLLNLQEQAQLVRILLDEVIQWRLPHNFDKVVPQLANLDESLRAELATWVTRTDDHPAAYAIHALGGGLVQFDAPSIDRLLDKATSLRDERKAAYALSGLSRGLAHMKPNQRQRLLQAAQDIGDEAAQDEVNTSLCAQLEHLPPGERNRLFDWAIDFPLHSRRWPPETAEGLAASAEVLTQGQRRTLVQNVLDRYSLPYWNSGQGIRALAANIEQLDPDLRIQLVDWVFSRTEWWAMHSLVPAFKHLPPHQQDLLLEAAAPPGRNAWHYLIREIAMALPSLEPAGRGKVAAFALGLDDDNIDRAMGALGPHLEYLEEDQRNTVAERALDILNILNSHAGKLNPPDKKALGALALGLGAVMGVLREDLRDKLVNAVAAFDANPDLFSEEDKYKYHVQTIAGVIAGLASGRQHLSGPQFQTLINAASRLEECIEQALHNGRASRGTYDEMKATVIFGLATA